MAYELSIDPKGRLSLPARIRRAHGIEAKNHVVIGMDTERKAIPLVIYRLHEDLERVYKGLAREYWGIDDGMRRLDYMSIVSSRTYIDTIDRSNRLTVKQEFRGPAELGERGRMSARCFG